MALPTATWYPSRVGSSRFAINSGSSSKRSGKPSEELYNLADDPGETVNLVEAHPKIVSELSQLLEAWRKSQARVASGKGPSTADEDVMRRLEALGYVQ